MPHHRWSDYRQNLTSTVDPIHRYGVVLQLSLDVLIQHIHMTHHFAPSLVWQELLKEVPSHDTHMPETVVWVWNGTRVYAKFHCTGSSLSLIQCCLILATHKTCGCHLCYFISVSPLSILFKRYIPWTDVRSLRVCWITNELEMCVISGAVIDLTNETPDQEDLQKAIAASLQESQGILGGQVTREEQEISR